VTSPVRVRFAPSPTGFLHVGSGHSALANWLFARHSGGEFLLRIEDTDAERDRPELVDNVLEMLQWLGLQWDNDPPRQSQRRALYEDAAAKLVADGAVYACDCTGEQVQARNKEAGGKPGYDGFCRDRGLEPGPGRALRFRTPREGRTGWTDLVRGDVSFANADIEDFVVVRGNGAPMFLLANCFDDADMGITHVIRGEDHVNSTPSTSCSVPRWACRHRRPSPTCRCSSTRDARSCPSAVTTCPCRTTATGATCPRRW